jgi:hypothetical protein
LNTKQLTKQKLLGEDLFLSRKGHIINLTKLDLQFSKRKLSKKCKSIIEETTIILDELLIIDTKYLVSIIGSYINDPAGKLEILGNGLIPTCALPFQIIYIRISTNDLDKNDQSFILNYNNIISEQLF